MSPQLQENKMTFGNIPIKFIRNESDIMDIDYLNTWYKHLQNNKNTQRATPTKKIRYGISSLLNKLKFIVTLKMLL